MFNQEKNKKIETIFNRRLFVMSAFSRSLIRVLFYSFSIIMVGVIIALFISDVEKLNWLGALIFIIFADYLLHYRTSHYSISDFFNGKVPKNNVALCLNRESLYFLINAFEKALIFGGDPRIFLTSLLIEKDSVSKTLSRLDISAKEIKTKLENEIKISVGSKISREQALEIIKELVIKAADVSKFHLQEEIDPESLFVAVANSNTSWMSKILDFFGVTPDDINSAAVFSKFAYGRKSLTPQVTGGFAIKGSKIKSHRVNRSLTSKPTPVLNRFSTDLTDLARMGQAGFLIGHGNDYEQMINGLSRVGKRNVLLVGEPGVGKETIINHLAFQIINDNVPAPLFDRRLIKLSLGELVSGASMEDLTDRFKKAVDEIILAGNIILYIPDIHILSKTSQGKEMDLSDMLMPVIENASFPVIGTTYPKEFKEFVEPRSDFASSFEVLRIEEISKEDAITFLTYDAILLERQYRVTINFSAIKQSVILASKYLHYKHLPLSAQEILREALAWATQKGEKSINGETIVSVVERKTNIPVHRAGREEAQALLNLEDLIHNSFIDQEEAVISVARALRSYRAGLARKGGPIATFLFVGPTGVGKTELSKILSKIHFGSDKAMIRFDMSEFQQKDSISRLIGSNDGKIAGSLTETIIQKPYSLVLLDEFEKANSDILNLFLQVFDDGRLTDSLGRVVDFQNTIIITTSNAHSVFIQDKIRAGENIKDFADEFKKKLTEYFKPELLNRFSDVVVFKPLSLEDIKKVTKLNLDKLSKDIKESQNIILEFSSAANDKIAEIGYDPAFGARPLRKAIDDNIKSVLSEAILSEKIIKGGKVFVDINQEGNFSFSF
ncbi:MAG: ATP-dependent Clp protease ATP-binding subunit [Candidatus Paceibacterota bacterium]|jgi:ATP-dependent Clp protease ATP-binding subunit ClpA